jgi:hypothetical protein
MANLRFHPVGYAVDVVHSSASGSRNINALFSMPGWGRYEFHKNGARTLYTKILFLHPVGSTGHVAHSGAFGA